MGGGLDLRAGPLWAWSSLADSARDAETHTDRLAVSTRVEARTNSKGAKGGGKSGANSSGSGIAPTWLLKRQPPKVARPAADVRNARHRDDAESRIHAASAEGSFRKLGVPYIGVFIMRVLLFRVLD